MSADRRDFLKSAAAGVGTAAALQWTQSRARAATANDRLRFGVIGCGGQGRAHIAAIRELANAELAYVCDVDQERLARASEEAPGAEKISDLRRILDDDSIDVVSIATPDHWHAPAAILALDAGKHVYVEKPCCHNLREGRLLVEAARRNERLVQHGTQSRSSRYVASAIELLREGVIGDVLVAKAWDVQFRNAIGRTESSAPPPQLDYDLWVGPAEMVPFQTNRSHYTWHWWYNFGTGDMGNDGVHDIDYARWGLGVHTHPTHVAALGGKYFHDDDQEFPDTQTVVFEYDLDGASKQLIFELRLWSTNYPYNVDSGAEFWGTKGRMFLSKRGKCEILGERNEPIDRRPEGRPGVSVAEHFANFAAAIREGATQNADVETAHATTALVHLGNLATRLGRSFTFDPNTERVLDDDEADQMLARTYRAGHWAIPEGIA